jgi:GGDEF domain-containing protein
MVTQLALGSITSFAVCSSVPFFFWSRANHVVLLLMTLAVDSVQVYNVAYWLRRRSGPEGTGVSRATVWSLSAVLAVSALLHALIASYVVTLARGLSAMSIVAVAAGFIVAGTWLFANLPQAALAWSVTFCSADAVGMLMAKGAYYLPLASLLGFLCLVLVPSILVTSRTFVTGLIAQTEIEHQRAVMGLLLRDFEEPASDWLWETDWRGRLCHVSTRFAQAVARPEDDLLGRPLEEVVTGLLPHPDNEERTMLDALKVGLARQSPFRDLVLPTVISGERRWFSFTAKPLVDPLGQLEGWRGVGSDITAVRQRELEAHRLANVDTLTGLANRHRFGDHLRTFFPGDSGPVRPCTPLMLDLGSFKAVNDSFGHVAGDELLVAVARRLARHVRDGELLARLGGDEFAVFVPGQLQREEAERFVARLKAISGPGS